jgi:hypothetical protein
MATKKLKKAAKAPTSANLHDLMKVGDRVRIRHYGGQQGRIVEYRGALGPNGAHIYRVVIGRRPQRSYIELREDQLEPIPADA